MVALFQQDVKKVIAYSTMSQLDRMVALHSYCKSKSFMSSPELLIAIHQCAHTGCQIVGTITELTMRAQRRCLARSPKGCASVYDVAGRRVYESASRLPSDAWLHEIVMQPLSTQLDENERAKVLVRLAAPRVISSPKTSCSIWSILGDAGGSESM
nr:hypothetical protein CFP56_02688 [Quercus suber]